MPGTNLVHGLPAYGTGKRSLGTIAVLDETLGAFLIRDVAVQFAHVEPEPVAGLAPVNDDTGVFYDIHRELAVGAMARHGVLYREACIYELRDVCSEKWVTSALYFTTAQYRKKVAGSRFDRR